VAYRDGERIVETERPAPRQPEALRVVARHGVIDAVAIGDGRELQHRGVRRSRVLDVQVDLSRRDRRVAHERTAQVKASLHRQARAPLDLLRHDLAEQVGFREVLGPDDDALAAGAAGEYE